MTNDYSGGQSSGSRLDDRKPRSRLWIIWLGIFGGIMLLMFVKERMDTPAELITQLDLQRFVESNWIARATINYSAPQSSALSEVVGTYYKGGDPKVPVNFRLKVRLTPELEDTLFKSGRFEPREPNTMLESILVSVLPFVIIAALIWFFFIRQIRRVRGTANISEIQAKTEEQQARFDRVLEKWESQAQRIDGLIEKWERRAKDD